MTPAPMSSTCCSTVTPSSSCGPAGWTARRTHGTGCTFASALAAGLALGRDLHESAAAAQQYVAGAIAHARSIGRGAAILDHFWNVRLP